MPHFRIKVAFEFSAGDVVELFENKALGFVIGKLAVDGCQQRVSLGNPRSQGGLVLVQCVDLFLVGLVMRVQRGKLDFNLLNERLIFGCESFATQPV